MLNKPEDLKGKWFSNITGRPEVYHYVVEAKSTFKSYYFTEHIVMLPKKKPALKTSNWNWNERHKNFDEPIKDGITIERLQKRLIKGLLR